MHPPPRRMPVPRLIALLLLGVAFYYGVWGGEYSLFDLRRLDREKAAVREAIARAVIEVDSLRDLARRLENDPATIEAVARERFGMIRPGEVLYRFVEVNPGAPTDSAARPTP
jgi:cell division protein FtsB